MAKIYEDWQLPEYEERLEKAKGIKEILDNPPDDILHSKYKKFEEHYHRLIDWKTSFYLGLKNILEKPRVRLLKLATGKIVYFLDEWSDAGHPKFYYFGKWSLPVMGVTTSRGLKCLDLSKKEFIHSLMDGKGFDEP